MTSVWLYLCIHVHDIGLLEVVAFDQEVVLMVIDECEGNRSGGRG